MPDWKALNRWEEQEKRERLRQLTPDQALRQYFDLWEFSLTLAKMGHNYDYLTNLDTNPHLQHLIEFNRRLGKLEEK